MLDEDSESALVSGALVAKLGLPAKERKWLTVEGVSCSEKQHLSSQLELQLECKNEAPASISAWSLPKVCKSTQLLIGQVLVNNEHIWLDCPYNPQGKRLTFF